MEVVSLLHPLVHRQRLETLVPWSANSCAAMIQAVISDLPQREGWRKSLLMFIRKSSGSTCLCFVATLANLVTTTQSALLTLLQLSPGPTAA